MVHFGEFLENLKLAVKQCYQTGQFELDKKLVENAKFQKFKCDILSNFQTMCILQKIEKVFELFASILTFQFSKKCEYHQRKVPHHDPLWHITDLPRNYLRRS